MATKVKPFKHDIEADAAPVASQDTLKEITKLADELTKLQQEADELSVALASKNERARLITEELLPAQMQTAGMKKFELTNGDLVSIKAFVRATIPTQSAIDKADPEARKVLIDRRARAFKWLIANNAEPLIKTVVAAEFGKGEATRAKAALQILRNAGVTAALEQNVHNSTLVAFLKEQLEAGVNIPSDVFSLFTGQKAELKRAK